MTSIPTMCVALSLPLRFLLVFGNTVLMSLDNDITVMPGNISTAIECMTLKATDLSVFSLKRICSLVYSVQFQS